MLNYVNPNSCNGEIGELERYVLMLKSNIPIVTGHANCLGAFINS